MKKVNKLFVLSAVIMALLFIMSSCNCGVDKKDAAGAIGKVEKYRKDQMSEKDIKLRSELTNDTAALRNTLRGMLLVYVYNDAYLKKMKESADELRKEEEQTGMDLGAEDLGNYCTMAENGNGQICQVCQMCADIINDTVTEFSFDVEQNIRNYAVYMSKLQERDSLVSSVIDKSDFWINENEKDDKKKDQINKVKKIRDEILLRDLTQAIVTNNNDKINNYSGMVVYNVEHAVNAVYNVNSFDEFKDVVIPKGFENLEANVDELKAVAYSEHKLEGIDVGVNAIDNFNATGNVDNLVKAIDNFNSYYVVSASDQNLQDAGNNMNANDHNLESQTNMDAAGNVQQAQENLKDIRPQSNIVYNSFVFNDKNVVESFTNVMNAANMNDIAIAAFPNYNAAGNNVSSQVNIDAFTYANEYVMNNIDQFSNYMSNYVVNASGVNYNNITNLEALIVPD